MNPKCQRLGILSDTTPNTPANTPLTASALRPMCFMSGNTTRLAVAISAGDVGLTGRLSLLVATFVVGNALGVVVSRLGRRHALPLLLCIAARASILFP